MQSAKTEPSSNSWVNLSYIFIQRKYERCLGVPRYLTLDTAATFLVARDKNRSEAQLLRVSPERRNFCQWYYNLTIKMAKMKCTHFIRLLEGLTPGRRIALITYKKFKAQAAKHGLGGKRTPLNEQQYLRLIESITSQLPWKQMLTWLASCRNTNRLLTQKGTSKSSSPTHPTHSVNAGSGSPMMTRTGW